MNKIISIFPIVFQFSISYLLSQNPIVKEISPYAYLLVTSDLDVRVLVLNNQNSVIVKPIDELVKIGLDAGDNIIKITPLDGGSDGYTVIKKAVNSGNIVLQIDLGRQRHQNSPDRQKLISDSLVAVRVGADNLAWEVAKTTDTKNSYDKYLLEWPDGLHRETAVQSLKSLMKPAVQNDPILGTLVLVRGGTYPRGCQEKPCIDEMEKPIHNVTLNDFYIGQTEVTQAQWRKIMGTSPSYYSGCDQCPVESISWFDIQEFLRRSNNRTSGGQFRLPTEAEWEYAARGGHMRHKDRQPDVVQISEIGWHLENSGGKTHPVKGKIPNQLGLYDMIGNVWEWCSDWYDTYKSKSLTNPTGPVSGALRVTRGCSYMDQSHFCRPVMRWHEHPESKMASIGFRIVFQTD